MLAVLCGVATSQTLPGQVINNQVQVGDIFSQGELNIVTVEEGVDSSTTATGNSVQAYSDQADMAVTSNQTLVGSVVGQTVVNVTGSLGKDSYVSTAAIGNTADIGANQSTVTGVVTQISTFSPEVTARTQIEGETAQAGNVNAGALAMANNVNLGLTNGSAGVRVNQTNGADVLADGGAVLQYVSGTSSITGVAVGNNISSVGDTNSAARLAFGQTNNGGLVQASQFTAYGNAQTAVTSTTAVGNAVSAYNEGPLLDVTNYQANNAYVRSQSEGSAYLFGSGSAIAYGAGNSAIAGNTGAEVVLDNTQWNGAGGVEVIATFTGNEGYDGYAQATAVGNDVTGYACSDCTGSMAINNSQTNNGDVSARSGVTVNNGRSVTGVSNATGNSAVFYVTRPQQ